MNELSHWADINADKIIRERPDKDIYVCASGITPSGTIHIGNFREIISVELVVRALKARGKNVRFIYSWDDYDVFRKVPQNMPRQELLAEYLRKPVTHVPDVLGDYPSYAAHNEKTLEKILPLLGIVPQYIYQYERYTASVYADGIKKALDCKADIRQSLEEHRTAPLSDDWWPISVFCTKCDRDTTCVEDRPSDYEISYSCQSCGHQESLDLRNTGAVKLLWRIDWPMRWAYEQVDFEPAGKDHHSEGGSFDTAKSIALKVYGTNPPVTFQYDFVRIKGGSGKISSSGDDVVSLTDVLRYYQPEVVRFLFAGTRPNSEFAISFDLDVLKIYEDYDKVERTYFDKPDNPKKLKKWQKDARIYELSQIHDVPQKQPYQIQIRHLTTLLQIYSGDIDAVIQYLGDVPVEDIKMVKKRAICSWNWLQDFAPEDFRYSLRSLADGPVEMDSKMIPALNDLSKLVQDKLGKIPGSQFSSQMYDVIHKHNLESAEFFTAVYLVLIGKSKGPRLINFLHILGADKVSSLLGLYEGD